MTVSFRDCRNPTTVEVRVLIDSISPESEGSGARAGFLHGEIQDPLHATGAVTVLENPSSGGLDVWQRAAGAFSRRTNQGAVDFGAPLAAWHGSSLMSGMATASEQETPVAVIRFKANWVLPRSSGTCFVRFPTLQVPQVDPTAPPNTASPYAPTPGPGAVDVLPTSGETVQSQASIPPPSDPRIPRWTCASMAISIAAANSGAAVGGASDCGGVAVFSEPGVDSHLALWLLIDGAFMGVAAAMLVDAAIRFRNPRTHSESASTPGDPGD